MKKSHRVFYYLLLSIFILTLVSFDSPDHHGADNSDKTDVVHSGHVQTVTLSNVFAGQLKALLKWTEYGSEISISSYVTGPTPLYEWQENVTAAYWQSPSEIKYEILGCFVLKRRILGLPLTYSKSKRYKGTITLSHEQ